MTTSNRICCIDFITITLCPGSNSTSMFDGKWHHAHADCSLSALVKCFTTPELMRWPGIESIYGPHLRKTSVFSSDKLWEDLHIRVIEHVSDFLVAHVSR